MSTPELFPNHFPLALESDRAEATRSTVNAPYDGSAIATVSTCDEVHVDHALAAAHALLAERHRWLSVHERAAILERAAALMLAQAETLALEAAREGGKPLTDSRVEVARAADGLKLCAEHIRGHAGSVIPMAGTPAGYGKLACTQKEPIGVVVAVSAFNHPLNLIVHQAGAAVAAGCPVIVKPADDTPLSCLRLQRIFYTAGLPAPWLQVAISKDLTVAETLVTDPRVGFFSFIGSARVGWMLRSKLAPGTRCALEHGGAAPLIIGEHGDLDKALPAILKGGFYHAGQVCVSVQRIFVPRGKARDLAARLGTLAAQLTVGDPTSADTDVGPLIRHAETARVARWVDDAVAAGAELIVGGKRLSPACYAPTVLLDPPPDTAVCQREIFGPVVAVISYDRMDDAIAQANALDVAFQAAVFTENIAEAMYVYQRIAASAVMVNEHTAFRVDGMPFAGLRQSGLGVGGIGHTIEDMQIDKMLVLPGGQ